MAVRKLCTPMPGLIALKCRDGGASTMLAVLGIGVVESDGTPDRDAHIATGYADLATDADPAKFVLEYWADQVAQHPWLGAHLDVLTGHLRKPSPDQVAALVKAAAYLSTVKLSGAEETAGADLLGRCYTEMVAITNKRATPGHSFNLAEGMLDAVFSGFTPQEGDRVADLWSASGMRCVGAATWMRAQGLNPQTVTWIMCEGDPVFRAIAAINAVAFELGDSVEIIDGTEYKQSLIAAHAKGRAPVLGGSLIDVERLEAPGVQQYLTDTRG